jgi:hypothetical protein
MIFQFAPRISDRHPGQPTPQSAGGGRDLIGRPSFKTRFESWVPALAGMTVFLFLLSACGGSRSHLKIGKTAEGEVVEAEGLAPNDPAQLILTKRASLNDAHRNAVEKAVGVFVSGRTMVEKAVAIENNILAKTEGYIKKYDILSEGADGPMYKTKIRALVALKDLERDLKDNALMNLPDLKKPRVYLDINEEAGGALIGEDVVKSAISKMLMERGFVVLGQGRSKEAEVQITGKASAFPFQSDGLGGFVSFRARLTVQSVRTGTLDTILTLSKEASGLGGNDALAAIKALETVGELVGVELSQELPRALKNGKSGLVFVEGVKSFEDVDKIKKRLTSQPGVRDVALRLYDEGLAQFELELDHETLTDLASSLEASQTFPLRVLETKPQFLRLKLD